MKLGKKFFSQDTIKIARNLLGKYLVHKTPKGTLVGKIVETEGYLHDDEASHSFKGLSKRNAVMFDHPGKAYVYLIYGMYECFNIVTNKKSVGEAVLIRALEPVEGIELMKKNRKKDKIHDLCSGPGKLTIAMGIERKHSGLELKNEIYVEERKGKKEKIVAASRIGISKNSDANLRFYIKDNPFISK